MRFIAIISAALIAFGGAAMTAGAEEAARKGRYDRHEYYYYPPLKNAPERYKARAVTLPEASRKRRIAFVTALTNQMMQNPYPPPFAVFAKGEDAEKLIVVGLYNGGFDTLYRARGLFAQLTAAARLTPIFRKHQVEDVFTFFDLLKLQGFSRVTITDGKEFSHQVRFQ